ncbi:ESX secretion-associated protein EspG [Nocardia sp. XZ_19_385]|uniref:ESX secretion-associated protein EspG n=1 Tax=Nocardia sp. XZ_19_385 TaxID=2769488 RepID=UPI001890A89B|nr:ESX secretion-associated protein EspG [Nocardia sp. XZ_19_385]
MSHPQVAARTWHFTDLEFVVAWEPMKNRSVPSPFIVTSRIPDFDEFRRRKAEVRARQQTELDEDVRGLLDTLARPDLRVLVTGTEAADPADPGGVVRMLAARRGDKGCLATQLPGETLWHARGFTLTACDALALGRVVAEALPQRRPGQLGRIVLPVPKADMDYSPRRGRTQELTEDRTREYAERFNQTAVVGSGSIEITQGSSLFGPRGMVRRWIRWRDLEGDGRYATAEHDPSVAVAADPARLTALINTEIAEVIRVIKDERA